MAIFMSRFVPNAKSSSVRHGCGRTFGVCYKSHGGQVIAESRKIVQEFALGDTLVIEYRPRS